MAMTIKNKEEKVESVLDVINAIPQQPQVQYDLTRQLRELYVVANKLGLYDAADYLANNVCLLR